MKKFKITIDRNLCIGCGGCAEIDPNVFAMDSENKSVLKIKPVCDNASGIYNKTLDAAKSCPVNAIVITEMK